jgi:hypothetical protein
MSVFGPAKGLMKRYLPGAYDLTRRLWYNHVASPGRLFADFYDRGVWQGDSRSGIGSTLENTETLRLELPRLFHRLRVQVLMDAPCGDFHWMKAVDFSGIDRYLGVDIVPGLIAQNQASHADAVRSFLVADLIEDQLPEADLILCRDCLIHLSNHQCRRILRNFKRSGSRYVGVSTYPSTAQNVDIAPGSCRALDLCKPPFNLPAPLELIFDGSTDDQRRLVAGRDDTPKYLGIWRLANLSGL